MVFQYGKILHVPGMQLELQALEARHDVKVHMKYGLPGGLAIELGNHNARRLESLLYGGSDGLHGLYGAAEYGWINIV